MLGVRRTRPSPVLIAEESHFLRSGEENARLSDSAGLVHRLIKRN